MQGSRSRGAHCAWRRACLRFGIASGGGRPAGEFEDIVMGILWIIVVGFVAGIVARILSPGANDPKGFLLTTVLGIAGAFLATLIGQTIGWYRPDQGAGFIAAIIGALVVLFIWNRLVASGRLRDPGAGPR
jgi:uncharacterized membrane protein YeaQ/YmgE (transglycosylase-associated protein family)